MIARTIFRTVAILSAASLLTAAAPGEVTDEVTGKVTDEAIADPAAPGEDEVPRGLDFDGHLQLRLWGDAADPAPWEGADPAAQQALFHRIRLGGEASWRGLAAVVEADLLGGRLAGAAPSPWPVGVDAGAAPRLGLTAAPLDTLVEPRELYLRWDSPVGQLRAGLQTSQWGLGLLANGGAEDDDNLFNQRFGGDRVLRAVFATAPLRAFATGAARDVYLAVGADTVYRDENGSYRDDDLAYQGIGSIFYRTEATTLGTYVAYRTQEDATGDTLDVLAVDVHGQHRWNSPSKRWHFTTGVEAVYLTGSTTRTYATSGRPSVDVEAFGLAAEAEAWNRLAQVGARLLAGYASGDADRDDERLYRFRFDPNYKVGLVLFDHYLPAATRAQYDLAHDPYRAAQTPHGVEGIINPGAVENALYLNPQLLLGDPDGLLGGIGVLWARSTAPLTDPVATFEHGGSPVGINGLAPASNDLGWEFDAAVRYRHGLAGSLTLEAKAEYGIFFPGRAFADALGHAAPAQNLLRGRLALIW